MWSYNLFEKVNNSSYALLKQKDWIAVGYTIYQPWNPRKFLETVRAYGYQDSLRTTTLDLEDSTILDVPSTLESLEAFLNGIGCTILFAGEPDWMMIQPRPLDFEIICGKSEFVTSVIQNTLGMTIEESFQEFEDLFSKTRYVSETGRKNILHMMYQMRDEYPHLKPGESIQIVMN